MPKPRGYNKFHETGWPSVCDIAYSTNGGGMIAAPGAGKHVHILGVITYANLQLKAGTSTGTTIASVPGDADGLRFPGAIDMGENQAVYAYTTDDVTIFYYIHDTSTE